jgi:hypothetical protein
VGKLEEKQGLDFMMILPWALKKWDDWPCTEFNWMMIGISGGLL